MPTLHSFVQDDKVPFPAYYIRAKTKTEMRLRLVDFSLSWIRMQRKRGAKGAIMVDIDDTLIDGNECVQNGFQFMHALYKEASLHHPIHVVTARPDDQHEVVMQLLQKRGFCVPPDRLHMLPSALYGKDYSHVEKFKWNAFLKIGALHGGVLARFGDKMWDVAHLDSLHTSLTHVGDKACYVFLDPSLKGTMSGKLPGAAD